MLHPSGSEVWELARRQHGVVARGQLLGLGWANEAIKHRIAKGRLHPVGAGVYAIGRPELTREGRWMAAVLSCGSQAVLSHFSAAALWEIGVERRGNVHVSVPAGVLRRRPGVVLHRRKVLDAGDATTHRGIPVTTPARTLVDLATSLSRDRLETAVNEADKHDLVDPEALHAVVGRIAGQPGVAVLRTVLDHRTLTLTDSELERRFLPIARKAGLPPPKTQHRVNGFRVDFFWPDLGLVVETDGLRYHRTPAEQARDRVRDQAHAAAGLTALRFTRAQVRFERAQVRATLAAVAGRLLRVGT